MTNRPGNGIRENCFTSEFNSFRFSTGVCVFVCVYGKKRIIKFCIKTYFKDFCKIPSNDREGRNLILKNNNIIIINIIIK